uniref:Proteasome alpha-type subunits domain-containing protein n=1 Tax=Phocoena sinus TaxID=42100 RepID=A0A8C9BTL5_PHOSS
MSSIGTRYDLSASTFSPDGRVFQVEYAMKAVENSMTHRAFHMVLGAVPLAKPGKLRRQKLKSFRGKKRPAVMLLKKLQE